MSQSLTIATKGYWVSNPVALASKGYIDSSSFIIAGCPVVLASKGVLGSPKSLASKGIVCPSKIEYEEVVTAVTVSVFKNTAASRAKYRDAKRYEIVKEDRFIRITVFCDGKKYVSTNAVKDNLKLKISSVKIKLSPHPEILVKILR